jgi:hypothetical protein
LGKTIIRGDVSSVEHLFVIKATKRLERLCEFFLPGVNLLLARASI